MNVAFLFNSDAEKYEYFYREPIKEAVFGLGILQKSKRHMKVSVGDVTIYGRSNTWAEYAELTQRTYYTGTWSLLHDNRLRATFRKATVYALIFENITKAIATELHEALTSDEAYLGALEVDYTYGPHLVLFRNTTINLYRIEGELCRVFYSMGEENARDASEPPAMRELGYSDVDWEDRGAHGTIFDDFDTLEHFERVADFREAVAPFLSGGDDDASELVMILEDLNPQLFNALGAAVQALERAKTEEDIAQAALSGRRYMERLVDVLFPARAEPYNGRQVGKAEYRNRIWAFIDTNTRGFPERKNTMGKEVDRVDGDPIGRCRRRC